MFSVSICTRREVLRCRCVAALALRIRRWLLNRTLRRLLRLSCLLCRMVVGLSRLDAVGLHTGENLFHTVLVAVARALHVKRNGDYLPDLVSVKLGAAVAYELQHGSILESALTRIWVEAGAVYDDASLHDGLCTVLGWYLLGGIDIEYLPCKLVCHNDCYLV